MRPVHYSGDEAGVSLIEVLVASILTLVLLIMAYEILNTSSSTAGTIGNRAHNSTEARLTIDALEANLRLAQGVWVCAPATATPQTASTATLSCPTYSSGVAALLVSNDASPTCTEWVIGSGGLYEVGLGTVSGGSFPLTPLTNIPGVTVASYNGTATAGFALSLPGVAPTYPYVTVAGRLVQIDLSVNQDLSPPYRASDAVSVHDDIAPDNLMNADDVTSTPCS